MQREKRKQLLPRRVLFIQRAETAAEATNGTFCPFCCNAAYAPVWASPAGNAARKTRHSRLYSCSRSSLALCSTVLQWSRVLSWCDSESRRSLGQLFVRHFSVLRNSTFNLIVYNQHICYLCHSYIRQLNVTICHLSLVYIELLLPNSA